MPIVSKLNLDQVPIGTHVGKSLTVCLLKCKNLLSITCLVASSLHPMKWEVAVVNEFSNRQCLIKSFACEAQMLGAYVRYLWTFIAEYGKFAHK